MTHVRLQHLCPECGFDWEPGIERECPRCGCDRPNHRYHSTVRARPLAVVSEAEADEILDWATSLPDRRAA